MNIRNHKERSVLLWHHNPRCLVQANPRGASKDFYNFSFKENKLYEAEIKLANNDQWVNLKVIKNPTGLIFEGTSKFIFEVHYETTRDLLTEWSIAERRVLVEKTGCCL